jgi:hypothetical protein
MEKLNSLAIRVLNQAIEVLPRNQQSRYAEEWRSHYAELTNPGERLHHALGCASCAFKTQAGLNGLPEPAGFRIEVPGFGAVESDLTSGLRVMVFHALAIAQRDSKFSSVAQVGWSYLSATMHLMNEKERDRMDNYLASLQPQANGVFLDFHFEGIKYSYGELPEVLEYYFRREIEKLA